MKVLSLKVFSVALVGFPKLTEGWCGLAASSTSPLLSPSSASSSWFAASSRQRHIHGHGHQRSASFSRLAAATESNSDQKSAEINIEAIEAELTEYLKKRKEMNADDLAKLNIGRVVGGTKGNKILEYVSGSPNKAFEETEAPNPLDYDELTKYGYGHLVTPIMNAGGRLVMYALMNMEAPVIKRKPIPKPAKLIFDRTGETDTARYKGIKLGQVYDDAAQGEALYQAQRRQKQGEELRPRLAEQYYVQPFADKRNIGPKQTAYSLTVEDLDEIGKMSGKASAWASNERRGRVVKDPLETMELDLAQRVFAATTALLAITAYGRATPTFLTQFVGLPAGSGTEFLEALQVPALVLLAASVGSAIVCGKQASEKKRSQFVWAFKGLMGGPLSIQQLRGCSELITQGEIEEAIKQLRQQ